MRAESPEGETILVTRGDTGMLAKSFAMDCTEDLDVILESDEVPISRFDSTIAFDDITARTAESCGFDKPTVEDEAILDEAIEEVELDLATGRMYSKEGREIDSEGQQSASATHPSISGRHSHTVRSRRSNAETLPERYLAQVTHASDVPGPYSPPMPEFIVRAAVSHEEFMRRNPTNKQAMNGPDREKWLIADKVEEDLLSLPQKGRDGPVLEEFQRSEVPHGMKILPVTKQRKIKSNGKFKSRFCVMGNLDDFDGPTYASTASKKIVWLLFALTTRLG